ncbi:hypothetical protein DPEC_G00153860 [Dallia pectoralis]|uniref:Uncharacterized protein n=1 Tax=Dallia pectoralis TaxID=75939 RepID=A0ACC2GK26_DALPE|nr:hypothetical protein DPEC_G00153860 [Dallia pectoralis]
MRIGASYIRNVFLALLSDVFQRSALPNCPAFPFSQVLAHCLRFSIDGPHVLRDLSKVFQITFRKVKGSRGERVQPH